MTSLKGNLNSVDLANIFQMLTLNQREGTLYIFEGASKKAIYFGHDGVSMLARGRTKSDALGRILLRYDRVAADGLAQAARRQSESGRLLGQVLVEDNHCSRADIEEALQIQIQEEVYSLFIWKDAQFEFVEGEPDEEFRSEGAQKLTFNVNSVIMEAARRVDEWEWIRGLVPDSQEVFRYTSRNVPLTDSIFQEPYAGKVLAAVDGRRSADEIIDVSYVNKFEVCKILALLLDAGAIETLPVPDLRAEAEAAVAAGDTGAALKFLSRLVAVKGDTPPLHEQLAQAFENEHEIEKAVHHYSVFAELEAERGQSRTAFDVYRRISTLLPTDLSARDRMIEIFANHHEGLEEHAAEVIARGKELAEIYAELKRASRAIQVLHRVVSLAPEDPDLRHRLIAVYLLSGLTGEAISEYEALAETALATGESEAAEKIFRKILTIDRQRQDIVARLDSLISRKRRRRRNIKSMAIAGGLVAGLAVAASLGLSWYHERRSEALKRETESMARLEALRVTGTPLRGDLDALLKETTKRPADLVELAADLKLRTPRVADAERRTNEAARSLTEFRAEFQGLAADEDALTLVNELTGRLVSLKKAVAEVQRSLRDNASASLEQAQQMLRNAESTRGAMKKVEFAVQISADCDDWLTTDEGRLSHDLLAQLHQYLNKFETTRTAVEQKIADNDAEAAYELAVAYLADRDFPPVDLKAEIPVPIRLTSRPQGAHVLTRDGVDTGLVTGPACIVKLSIVKGAAFELELPGFKRAILTLPPFAGSDPAALREKFKGRQDILLEKAQAFRKGTSDGKAVTATPFASRRYMVIPSNRACDVVDLAKGQVVRTITFGGERSIRASGVIAQQGESETVVLGTGDRALLFFDAATGNALGSWSEARGGFALDLVLAGGDVIAADDRGGVYCVGVASRQKRWSYAACCATGEPTSVSAAPVVAGGEVYVGCEDGTVRILDLGDGHEVRTLANASTGSARVCAPVAVSGTTAYVANRDAAKATRITKWDIASGKSAWSVVVSGEVRSAPMRQDGTVFIVATTGEMTGLRADDGAQSRTAAVDHAVKLLGEATLEGGVLYVGCDNGVLYAFDVRGSTIEPLWRFFVRNGTGKPVAITTRCVFAGGFVLFGAADNAVYALDGGN